MGRAYEVRKASIQKTGAVKAKLYSMYAKEIYAAAKTGGTDASSNLSLKRLIDKSKKDQVPADIIKRAIDKVNSGVDENYTKATYELFGPGGSTLLVNCLTDNMNRSVSSIRAALNKTNSKMGVSGSVAFMYDHLCILEFSGTDEEMVMETLINNDIEIIDIEIDNSMITVYGNPQDLYQMKDALNLLGNIVFETEEIAYLPKETVTLSGEVFDDFNKLMSMLDDIEDVQNFYHNVKL